jgi:hypothetical protein
VVDRDLYIVGQAPRLARRTARCRLATSAIAGFAFCVAHRRTHFASSRLIHLRGIIEPIASNPAASAAKSNHFRDSADHRVHNRPHGHVINAQPCRDLFNNSQIEGIFISFIINYG